MRRPIATVLVVAAVGGVLAAAPSAARAADPSTCPLQKEGTYVLHMQALTGPRGSDATLRVDSSYAECTVPTMFKKILLKTYDTDGSLDRTSNISDVEAPGGVAVVDLNGLPRGRHVDAMILVQTETPSRTYVVHGEATTLLRPDLVVSKVEAPPQTLTTEPITVTATVKELNGDVDATADVTLSAMPGARKPVTVPAGGTATVEFTKVALTSAVPVALTLGIDHAVPYETDATNNTRATTVEVTEHELNLPRVIFPALGGYGAQFNNHLWAPITPSPPADPATVEQRMLDLQPQLVRVFYNDNWDANANGLFPDWELNYASFVQSCLLAQETGATINVTFQTYVNAVKDPAGSMAKFAQVLDDLVRVNGCTHVRWTTIGNEPNNGNMTLPVLDQLYRAIDAQLVARGLRDHIGLMGGDLVESRSGTQTHYEWMKWIGEHMNDVLDAYSEHVYWWYDRPLRLEFRLRDIHNVMTNVLPPEQRKPTYLMEFGIRGASVCPGMPDVTNLYYVPNCGEIWRTNIAGFQQLWFDLESAQLGFAGTSKWDAYQANYDRTKNPPQIYWLTGPASEGYPVTPSYNALSLLFHTTVPGWEVVGVDPWGSDDWTVPTADYGDINGGTTNDTPEKELVGYAGPNGELTVLGLDTLGRNLNTVSPEPSVAYSIGGLPAGLTFRLAVWNATGDGTNSIADTLTTNAAGVVRFQVPLQAAFALTTVPVS